MDYLLSLVQLAELLKEYSLADLAEHLKLELLLEVPPTTLGTSELQELMYKRATILSPYV